MNTKDKLSPKAESGSLRAEIAMAISGAALLLVLGAALFSVWRQFGV